MSTEKDPLLGEWWRAGFELLFAQYIKMAQQGVFDASLRITVETVLVVTHGKEVHLKIVKTGKEFRP